MAKKLKLGSTKRFGPRYGSRNKEKIAALEKEHRGRRKCPFCNYIKVKRLSKGIWQCEKCNAKFAGKAYTFATAKKAREVKAKEIEEEPEEDIELVEEKETELVEQPEAA
ncbi:50S ribosomal protein L37ae [Candidatus Woesearchaeota archaeon]|jgi:large subunit ribosomal protein L37Ae|nr:50S ribosomal protein L37ae [Candidatus Woesearchaeota archaeon]